MADIQQWRRVVQPARARTPAVEHAGDDSDGVVASPTTPKRGLKPKFSSYFTNHGGSALAVRAEPSFTSLNGDLFAPRLPAWPEDEPYPSPNAERLIDSIMCRLMSDPYGGLDPRFNGMLMQIFECYRNVSDEKTQRQAQLDEEVSRRKALLQRLQHSQKQWTEEREDYKSEVKRLELLLATGKRGLAEVMLARQDSALRQRNDDRRSMREDDDGLETIFEFLEKTKRHEDEAWSSQRATFRTRQPSPSAQMRRLSRQLMAKKSMTNIHADLPFGTPPDSVPSTLAEASTREGRQAARNNSKRTKTGLRFASDTKTCFSPKTSFSNDTCSTFSCVSDLLPDETPDANLVEATGTDNDFVDIHRIANVLARRRNIDPSIVMPKLFALFDAQTVQLDASTPTIMSGAQLHTPQSTVTNKVVSASTVAKHPSLMSKASGFFQKLRPQLIVDTSISGGRRFSFNTGDDIVANSSPLAAQTLTGKDGRMLRKSVSLMSLAEIAQRSTLERTLSPVAQSPTTSAPTEPRRGSRIPTPVYSPGFLARPRQEREDSASSLLTAIQLTESEGPRREDSFPSLSYSSPSTNDGQALRGSLLQGANLDLRSSNRVLNHNIAVRGNAFAAAAAAKTTVMGLHGLDAVPAQPRSLPPTYAPAARYRASQGKGPAANIREAHQDHDLQYAVPRGRSRPPICISNTSTVFTSDTSETSKENVRPMAASYHLQDE